MNQWMRRRLGGRLAWIALAALTGTGCASNGPLASTKIGHAERAVDEAQQIGAAISAPVEVRTAEDKLKAAQAAMAKQDYDQAIRLAEEAAVDADYARVRAVNERVKRMADEMRQNIQTLRQELQRLPE